MPPAQRRLRVLLLEDNLDDAELAVRALAAAGFEVACDRVDTERAFTACLDAGAYDLILSDYNLPSFDGVHALRVVRARGLDLPFILVSGALGEDQAIETLQLGATDYVLKSRLERLAAAVRRALRDTEERRQRTRAEAALRESEERYRSLVENAPDIIMTVAPDGRFSSLNAAFESVLGWSRDEWLGQHFAALLHPDDVARGRELFARVLDGNPEPSFELRARTAAGGDVVQEITATVQWRDGRVMSVLAIARDVTARKRATELQRAQQEDAQVAAALVRVGHELISSVDLPVLLERLCRITTEVMGCDVSYTLMLREGRDELVPFACSGESTERWEALRAITIPLAGFGLTLRQRGADGVALYDAAEHGNLLPAELRVAYDLSRALTVRLQRGERVIGVHVAGDRSERGLFSQRQQRIALGIAQLASLALENARLVQQLEGANRLKSDFLATMSHELRTPLSVIIGYNQLLLDEVFGTLTPEQAASLDRVGTSARELLELISATLDISRLETGRAALNLQDIDLAELLSEIEAETRVLRDKPGVESVWRIAPDLPRVQSDAVKLKVLLKNLIANAMKFTDHGRVTVSVAARDGWLECAVADTGIGMSHESQALIFEPFRQGDSSNTRRHGGVGLGLYIVSRLLALLSGRIEVESAPGQGSTFRMWIPFDALPPARLNP